jgi:hypothetical protein
MDSFTFQRRIVTAGERQLKTMIGFLDLCRRNSKKRNKGHARLPNVAHRKPYPTSSGSKLSVRGLLSYSSQ